jgi:hypothetical protein
MLLPSFAPLTTSDISRMHFVACHSLSVDDLMRMIEWLIETSHIFPSSIPVVTSCFVFMSWRPSGIVTESTIGISIFTTRPMSSCHDWSTTYPTATAPVCSILTGMSISDTCVSSYFVNSSQSLSASLSFGETTYDIGTTIADMTQYGDCLVYGIVSFKLTGLF